jgi:tetratricopeptide (TPR) repeat protein
MRNVWIGWAAAGVLLASGWAAIAQSSGNAAMPPMEGMHAFPPPDQLPVPIRMTGIGNSHITIRATPEAQAWFDQGLTLMHDFWDYESAKAFEQAIRVDPRCAMCYWGLAQAEVFRGEEDKVYGDKALAEAERLEGKASRTDRLYIEAARAGSQGDSGHAEEVGIYRKLVKKEPHDDEARIYLANAVGEGFDDNGEPKPGTKEKIALLEAVLRDNPNDSAANHYWIHVMEPSNHPERAIPSAALLASLAPTSGHMVHMPGHIYYRVGDYASADRWFTASTEADEKYLREQHVSVDDDWNYVHNMMYSIANQMEQGRLASADALSDHLAAAHGELAASLYIWSTRDDLSRVSLRLPVALRVGDWSAVLTLLDDANLPDKDNTAHLRFLRDELRHFATGMQALEKSDAAAAEMASAEMDAGLWRESQDKKDAAETAPNPTRAQNLRAQTGPVPPKADAAAKPATAPLNPDADLDPLVTTLSIASEELRAGVLLAQGKSDAAKKTYGEAIAAEKKLGYHEPPGYIRPVAETEAEALLRAKDYAGAKTAYQAALVERPQSGWELYGIARADELAGNTAAAQSEYATFLTAWPSADATLPEVTHAKAAVGGSTNAAGQ